MHLLPKSLRTGQQALETSAGVGVAIVSAKLIANPEIKYRHLGVLLFKVEPSAIANVVIIIIIFVTTIVTIVLIIAGSGLY